MSDFKIKVGDTVEYTSSVTGEVRVRQVAQVVSSGNSEDMIYFTNGAWMPAYKLRWVPPQPPQPPQLPAWSREEAQRLKDVALAAARTYNDYIQGQPAPLKLLVL